MSVLHQLFFGHVTPEVLFNRTYFDAGFDTTAYTTTSTSFTTRDSVTTTEDSGKKYATFWTSTMNHADTSTDAQIRLAEGTTERQRFDIQAENTADRWSVGGLYAYDGGSNRTFNVQHATEVSATSTLSELSMITMRLENNDVYAHSSTTDTTTSSTYQTKCSVTIPKTGYYVVFGSCGLASSRGIDTTTMNLSPKARIFDGTNAFGEQINGHRNNTANYKPYNHVSVKEFTSGATISLQYASDTTGSTTTSIKQATLLCMYIGTDVNAPENFPNIIYDIDDNSPEDYTGSGFTGKGLVSTTSLNTNNLHLVLATALHCGWNFENSSISRLEVNGTTDLNGGVDFRNEATTDEDVTSYDNTNFASLMVARTYDFTGVTNIQWEWQRTGGSRATLRNANIVIIDLGIPV